MSGYGFHPAAAIDLEEIWDFIATDNPPAADRVISEILESIESVVQFPNRGYRRPDLTSRPLRFINTRTYLIAYAPDEDPLCVLAVVHGRRNPRIIAAILKGRE